MNILFIVLGIIAGIFALLLILALFAKKGYSVHREIVINKPKQEVFDYVKFIKNQDYYSKWVMTDPNMKKVFTETYGTVGFIYAWNGNKQAGEGEQEIKTLKNGERVDTEIRFVRPFAAVGYADLELTSSPGNQTHVRWGMSSSMKYPMNVMLLFMNMDKLLGKDLDISLNTLKGILEK